MTAPRFGTVPGTRTSVSTEARSHARPRVAARALQGDLIESAPASRSGAGHRQAPATSARDPSRTSENPVRNGSRIRAPKSEDHFAVPPARRPNKAQ